MNEDVGPSKPASAPRLRGIGQWFKTSQCAPRLEEGRSGSKPAKAPTGSEGREGDRGINQERRYPEEDGAPTAKDWPDRQIRDRPPKQREP